MASRLNEDLMNTNLDIPEGEIKIVSAVNPVHADAIRVHNKKKKDREEILKDKKDELKKPFLGTKGNTTVMPKTKELKKLKLSENLFKEAVMEYDEIETSDATRRAWAKGDKARNKDTWSDIYNELSNMKEIESPHRRLKTTGRYKASWSDAIEDTDTVRIGASRDGGIVVKAEVLSDLDFAKDVAETYGVDWKVKEHTSRYADSKYELIIYPDRPVIRESAEPQAAKYAACSDSKCSDEDSLNEDTVTLDDNDKKALQHLKDYRDNKTDMEQLHKNVEQVYGNKSKAVPRLSELDQLSDDEIKKALGEKLRKKSHRGVR